ncbi:diguanylate cyclase (GGDEF)-like protein [Mycolicibacterium sp. BK556]|uniref:GGDEF domain-containing protein n=1 Tax=unclassified Mycolicibacterium TaxID=2636767 RepID=UPI00160C97BA|nr:MULTISPECIES: GGDEF domain-containing protein [unclassified Mycolicibacterium]MBB3603044.1 diguanylate cyclase (GGDEF)-like protein [Mycolicibacterium sp. BK556]MBB3633239.1 diguanylate cyclase (GGDEF)-like protein [Mycolicibacterium sp. BK607]
MGEREFAIATAVLRATGYLNRVRILIGVLCIGKGLVSVFEQFHALQPAGPHGVLARTIHLAVLVSAIAIGIWWLVRPWPSHRAAIAFAVWGDVAVAAIALTFAVPEVRLSATVYMCLIGVFVAVLLGYRVLFLHCGFATATIAVFTWIGVQFDGASLSELSLFFMPAMTTVVVLPAIAAMVIEGTRRGLSATADAANRDPLTGLLNRRGLYTEVSLTLARSSQGTFLAVVVIDLDGFKQLNDDHGHGAGDATLRTVADQLTKLIRTRDIAARVGGDEFILVAGLSDENDLDSFVRRVQALTLRNPEGLALRSSVGVTWDIADTREFDLETVLHRADEAMYRAKRVGGGSAVVIEPPTAEEPQAVG